MAVSPEVWKVSWNDATAFCQWFSKKRGAAYNLPTEAQWEYACRARTTTFFYCGDSDATLEECAWFGANAGGKTHPVGELQPNTFGLYDMCGTVWEWCADRYAADYYAQSARAGPVGPPEGSARVFRGGSYGHAPRYSR